MVGKALSGELSCPCDRSSCLVVHENFIFYRKQSYGQVVTALATSDHWVTGLRVWLDLNGVLLGYGLLHCNFIVIFPH